MSKKGSYRNARRSYADKNKQERQQRSAEEQLKLLDSRLGVGVGALRERARLQKIINQNAKPTV